MGGERRLGVLATDEQGVVALSKSDCSNDYSKAQIDEFLSRLYLPILCLDGRYRVIAASVTEQDISWMKTRYGDDAEIDGPYTPRFVLAAIEERFRDDFCVRATSELADAEPQFSASRVVTASQISSFGALLFLLMISTLLEPRIVALTAICLSGAALCANGLFRSVLLFVGTDRTFKTKAPSGSIPDEDLPIYSVLVPLYREANVIQALAQALQNLDYPPDRLDIKLIVEADDHETRAAAAAITAGDERFSLISVPAGKPRTKPRACNYALPFVLGEFTVIFDAEDRPEPDQLRKAVEAFRAQKDDVACLQARLNFYNAHENWLTKLFALDYLLWFDYLLPGLDRLGIPMPLGGTSNHFRTKALKAIHGWDPYNVTEDADLGIRLSRLGFRVCTLDSTTFEEATNSFGNWTRQRSRWLKGYMQTWLVHMRSPRALLRNAGWGGFIGFQLFVGGTFLSALINPFMWLIFLASSIFGISILGVSFAENSRHISAISLLAANGLFVYLAMLAPVRRRWSSLTAYGLTAPIYWLLVSVAAARALWQLFVDPWRWEKTVHGLTKIVE